MAPVMVNAAMVVMMRSNVMMVAPYVVMTPRVVVMLHLLHHTALGFNRNRGQWRCDSVHDADAEAKHCSEKRQSELPAKHSSSFPTDDTRS